MEKPVLHMEALHEHIMPYIDQHNTDRVAFLGESFGITINPTLRINMNHTYRSQYMVALLCTKGTASGRIGGMPYRITSGQFCIVLQGKQMEGNYLSADFEGVYIAMSDDFLNRLDIANSFPLYQQVESSPLMMVSERHIGLINDYCNLCCSIIEAGKEENRLEALVLLTRAMFISLADVFHPSASLYGDHNRKQEITQKFLSLVEQEYRQHRDVAYYADVLCITPKYLSASVKEVTDMTASEWVERFVVIYAKSRLTGGQVAVQQVAEELNFPTQSLFGRYFKRLTGQSPLAYRRERP